MNPASTPANPSAVSHGPASDAAVEAPATPSHGLEAVKAILCASGGVAVVPDGRWRICVTYSGRPGTRPTRLLPDVASAAQYVSDLPAHAVDHGSLCLETMLREDRHGTDLFGEPYGVLISGFAIWLDPSALYGPYGLWADPAKWDEQDRVDRRRLSPAEMKAGRAFLAEQLSQSRVPATLALEASDGIVGFWRLAVPIAGTGAAQRSVNEVAWRLSRTFHGVAAAGVSVGLPVPVSYESEGKRVLAAKLRWCVEDRAYALERLQALVFDRSRELVERAPRRGGRNAPPVMLEARTLPEGWTFDELGLPPGLLASVANSGRTTGTAETSWLEHVAPWMAARRYGLLDVLEVLRAGPPTAAGELDVWGFRRARLLKIFEAGLLEVSDREPPRLPYGIRRIVPLGGPAYGRPGERFRISGGSAALPFEFEVSIETLSNPRALRRELGKQLGVLPYLVSKRVLDALLAAGLRDSRVRRRDPEAGGGEPLDLPALLVEYARSAKPLGNSTTSHDASGEDASGQGAPAEPLWPLAKDGLALFPLASLSAWLGARIRGEVPRKGELSAAIRALGGDDYGSVRLPAGRFARCWSLPALPGWVHRREGASARTVTRPKPSQA